MAWYSTRKCMVRAAILSGNTNTLTLLRASGRYNCRVRGTQRGSGDLTPPLQLGALATSPAFLVVQVVVTGAGCLIACSTRATHFALLLCVNKPASRTFVSAVLVGWADSALNASRNHVSIASTVAPTTTNVLALCVRSSARGARLRVACCTRCANAPRHEAAK